MMDDLSSATAAHTRAIDAANRITQLRILLFRVLAVLLEVATVFVAGTVTLDAFALVGLAPALPRPEIVALAYSLIVLVTNAAPKPSSTTHQSSPFAGLFAIFLVCLLLMIRVEHSTIVLVTWFALSAMGIAVCRQVERTTASHYAGALMVRRTAAFIGNSPTAVEMLRQIRSAPVQDIDPIGFFDDRVGRLGPLDNLLPRLGTIEDLISFIHDNELHDVYLALPWSATERITFLINKLRFLPLTVRLLPDHLPPALNRDEPHQLGGVVMPTLMLPPATLTGRLIKRGIDLVVSGLLLIMLMPVFLLTALLIKLDSPGPVFFMQPRSGQYGRLFRIFKFRSMQSARLDTAAETLVSRGDARVTRVGRIIRKYSIDEIPQILNVFLGDMSLVGPRPHAQRAKAAGRIYAEILDDYMLRYRVKPGITGWAQVNGWRGNTDTEEKLRKRVEFDFYYITHWSVLLDLKILFRTFRSVVAPPPDNV